MAFNGRDGEFLASIDALSKSTGSLRLDAQTRAPAANTPPAPWLLFAPLKGGRTEYVVEKAVELGVGRLMPIFTRRGDVGRVNLERLRANAREAAEQCERLDVPDIADGLDLAKILTTWNPARTLFVAAESGAAQPLVTAVTAAAGRPVAFLVGPEGGFDQQELDALRRLPFVVSVGLGPRVLRADTAAFSALAVWQAAGGDWRNESGDARPPNRT